MPPNSLFWHLLFKNFLLGACRPPRICTLKVLCTPVYGMHRCIFPYRPVKFILSAANQSYSVIPNIFLYFLTGGNPIIKILNMPLYEYTWNMISGINFNNILQWKVKSAYLKFVSPILKRFLHNNCLVWTIDFNISCVCES